MRGNVVTRGLRIVTLVSFAVVAGIFPCMLASAGDEKPAADKGTIRGKFTVDGVTEHRKFKVEDAVVSLKGEGLNKASAAAPSEPVVMDQNGIAFIPTVLAVVAGTTVEFRNNDPTLHNVHCHCAANKSSNMGVAQGEKAKTVFDKPEVVEVTCNIHAQMKAWIVVLANSFFSKPAPGTGEFRIENVPPGTWDIKAWHPLAGSVTAKVTVKAGEEASITLDVASKKSKGR